MTKNKKATRTPTQSVYGLFSSKRSQEVFGMSFTMIFSIILIVFFIIAGGIAINAFLGWQKCTQTGLFFDDLQDDINEAFNSQGVEFNKSFYLPSGIDYVCFVNLSANPNSANTKEMMIYQKIKEGSFLYDNNLYLYSEKNNNPCPKLKDVAIKLVDITWKNPVCIKVTNNAARIKFQRTYDNPLVKVFE